MTTCNMLHMLCNISKNVIFQKHLSNNFIWVMQKQDGLLYSILLVKQKTIKKSYWRRDSSLKKKKEDIMIVFVIVFFFRFMIIEDASLGLAEEFLVKVNPNI